MEINYYRTRINASRPNIKLVCATTDNVFTSLHLAKQLKGTMSMLVGTMRGSRKTMPMPSLQRNDSNILGYVVKMMIQPSYCPLSKQSIPVY